MMDTIGQLIRMNEAMARKSDIEYNEIKEIVKNNNRDKSNKRISDLYQNHQDQSGKKNEKHANTSPHDDDNDDEDEDEGMHVKVCQGAHPITGWSGGCPNAEIVVVGDERADAYKRVHRHAVKHATRLVPTTTTVKSTLIDPRNKDSP
jgi:hypothetical protein